MAKTQRALRRKNMLMAQLRNAFNRSSSGGCRSASMKTFVSSV